MSADQDQQAAERGVPRVGPQHEREMSRGSELACMVEDEAMLFARNDYASLRTSRQPSNSVWREKVCQWCYDVIDHLDASRDIVYVAMNILDRFYALESCSRLARSEDEYELAAMTGLFLALRLSGKVRIAASDITRMSRRGILVQDLLNMGKSMLEKLRWDQRLPTPSSFVEAFVSLLPPSIHPTTQQSLLEASSYLVEVSVCDSYFVGIPASKVAYAALVNAAATLVCEAQRQGFYDAVQAISGIQGDAAEIRALRSRLHHVYSQSEGNNSSVSHVIPEGETEDTAITLSKPVPMRCVSDHNLPSAFAPAIKREALPPQMICESSSPSPVTDCQDTPSKRPVSPPPMSREETPLHQINDNKRARTC